MLSFRVDLRADPVWEPLFALGRVCSEALGLPSFDPDDFMYMGKLTSPVAADVHMYKHRWTRRYLNIDGLGHAYRYVPAPSIDDDADELAIYAPLAGLREALLRALDGPARPRHLTW
jgi:hypothetical protein